MFRLARVSRALMTTGSLFLALTGSGCGGGDPTGGGGGGSGGGNGGGGGGGEGPVMTTSVAVSGGAFAPPDIQVSPGATVTFTWGVPETHNVTWVATPGTTNSGNRSSGSYQATMPTTPGTYTYYCDIHGTASSGMRGTITVQ